VKYCDQLTSWTTALLEKLIDAEMVKKFPAFMEPEFVLQNSLPQDCIVSLLTPVHALMTYIL